SFDTVSSAVVSALIALPSFALGILLLFVFSVTWNIFPVIGWVDFLADPVENLRHVFLPVLTLGLIEAAVLSRLLRNDLVAVLDENYIEAARARGLTTSRVVLGHALRPASFSLITVSGVVLGRLIGGTVIIETIFAIPGLGSYVI